jgi:hypothetical protein
MTGGPTAAMRIAADRDARTSFQLRVVQFSRRALRSTHNWRVDTIG